MQRRPDSRKGENGQVAVIGGSPVIHGAPLLSALAAEASGVDLIYVAVPLCHAEAAKNASLNFQVHPFAGDALQKKDCAPLLELMGSVDCAVLGPGVTEGTTHLLTLIEQAPCPLVLDAGALQAETVQKAKGKSAVLTPHRGELQRLGLDEASVAEAAKAAGVTIFLKGPVDQVISPDHPPQRIEGGNAGLTVGGTGDALAGLIAGLIAQGMNPYDACVTAGTIMKRAATVLYHEQGHAFTARDVIGQIPHLLTTL
jgi:NAD(P)H-hydrate epimerase